MKKPLILALTLLILAACSTANNQIAPYAVKDVSNVKEFTMTAKNWEFNPSEITVNKGDKVRLHIKNIDEEHNSDGHSHDNLAGYEHSFSLPDFNINVGLGHDAEETIEFVADKNGEFPFSCAVYCGTGHGMMKGMLVVK